MHEHSLASTNTLTPECAWTYGRMHCEVTGNTRRNRHGVKSVPYCITKYTASSRCAHIVDGVKCFFLSFTARSSRFFHSFVGFFISGQREEIITIIIIIIDSNKQCVNATSVPFHTAQAKVKSSDAIQLGNGGVLFDIYIYFYKTSHSFVVRQSR